MPVALKQGVGVLAMKTFGDSYILKSNTVQPIEALHYGLTLPVSVVITGIDNTQVLDQAFDVAVRFLRASLRGWIYCRDHQADCVQYTTDAGSQLGAGHQKWMMNQINGLVWPSPNGVGVLDQAIWDQTVKIAKNAGVIKNDPSPDASTMDLVTEALKGITDDTKGADYKVGEVQVTPGGN